MVSQFTRESNCSLPQDTMKTSQNVSVSVATGILVLVNLVGNCIICAVVLCNRFMRTPVNFLLLNLAVADLYIGICALPDRVFGSLYVHPEGMLGNLLCKIATGDHVMYTGVTVSAFSLSAIAYERYLAVVHPFVARKIVTRRKVFLFVTFDWLSSVVIVSFFWFVTYYDSNSQHCSIDPGFNTKNSIYTMLYGSLAFGMPFIVMLVLYGRVIRELIKKHDQVISREHMVIYRFKKRITFMLITITVIFAATWGAAATMVVSVGGYYPGSPTAITCTLLVCFNSSVNCFVYSLFSSQFRKGFRKLLNACGREDQQQRQNTISLKAFNNSHFDEQDETIDTKL